jgi:photosystem II stability/assembly factor-like uncharacterized protein
VLRGQEYWRLSDSTAYNYTTPYKGIDCFDSLNCVAVCNEGDFWPIARLTSDGGKTWHQIFRDTSIYDYEKKEFIWQHRRVLDVAYPDSNLIFLLHDYGVYWYSTNKGETWEKPGNMNGFEMLQNWSNFYNSEIGGFTQALSAYVTYDGCKTFKEITFPNKYILFEDIAFPDENNIYALCYNHDNWGNTTRILKSSNRGMDWDTLPIPPVRIRRILFFDTLNGFGYGMHRVASLRDNSVILKTTDGGYSWKIILDTLIGSKQNGLIQMSFAPDRINGITMGYSDQLLRTSDGGETWFTFEEYYSYMDDWPSDVHQITSNRFFILNQSQGEIWEYNEDGFTSVSPIEIADDILLYPNPASDYIEINIPPLERGTGDVALVVSVFDVLGIEHPATSWYPSKEGNVRIDVSSLSPGVYFVKVGDKMFKLVKM